jgi:hypothetical protein
MSSIFQNMFLTLLFTITFAPSVHSSGNFPNLIHGLGDSYAAGLGAGKLLDSIFQPKPQFGCLQFDGGYVHQLLALSSPGKNTDTVNRTVNLACSGAKTEDINDQIPKVGQADLVTPLSSVLLTTC